MTEIPRLPVGDKGTVENPVFDETTPIVPNHEASKGDEKPTEKNSRKRGLGGNKAARGGPRKLTAKDREHLVSFYSSFGLMLNLIKPRTAEAIVNNAEQCADSWMELADQNDNVRRAILGLLEGGAWGGVMMAHVPIMMSFLPDDLLMRVMPTAPDDESGDNEQ